MPDSQLKNEIVSKLATRMTDAVKKEVVESELERSYEKAYDSVVHDVSRSSCWRCGVLIPKIEYNMFAECEPCWNKYYPWARREGLVILP